LSQYSIAWFVNVAKSLLIPWMNGLSETHAKKVHRAGT
jgi:hypothetical protein